MNGGDGQAGGAQLEASTSLTERLTYLQEIPSLAKNASAVSIAGGVSLTSALVLPFVFSLIGESPTRTNSPKNNPPPTPFGAAMALPSTLKITQVNVAMQQFELPQPVVVKGQEIQAAQAQIQRFKEPGLKLANSSSSTSSPRFKKDVVYKESEIEDGFALVYVDPTTKKVEVFPVKHKIKIKDIDYIVAEASVANRDPTLVDDYIAASFVDEKAKKKVEGQIEKLAKELDRELDGKKGPFGQSFDTDVLKDVDDIIKETPKNMDKAAERKAAILKKLDELEKLYGEAIDDIKKNGLEHFAKHILPKFPKLTQKRLKWLIEHKKSVALLLRVLEAERLYTKWLKERLSRLSVREFIALAKKLVMNGLLKSIAGFLHLKLA